MGIRMYTVDVMNKLLVALCVCVMSMHHDGWHEQKWAHQWMGKQDGENHGMGYDIHSHVSFPFL